MANNSRRLVLFAVVGIFIGFLIHFIVKSHLNWPLEGAALLALLAGGGLVAVSCGKRIMPPLLASAGLAAFVGMLCFLADLRLGDSNNYVTPIGTWAGVAILILAAPFIMSIGRRADGDADWLPERYFDDMLRGSVLLAMSIFAALTIFGTLYLLSQLFGLIGVDILEDILGESIVFWPLMGLALGVCASILRDREGLLDVAVNLFNILFAILAPILGVGALAFLALLPIVGLDELWGIGFASALLLSVLAIGIALANSSARYVKPGKLRAWDWPVVLFIVAMPLLAGLAALAIWLRIDQYGLSPDRIGAVAIAAILSGIALSYSLGMLASRFSVTAWRRWANEANLAMAGAGIAVAFLLLTPWLDPFSTSAARQADRLRAGVVSAEAFDFGALQFDMGDAGRQVLQELAKDPVLSKDEAVTKRIEMVQKFGNRWDWTSRRDIPIGTDFDTMTSSIIVLPEGAPLAPDFFDQLAKSSPGFFNECTKELDHCRVLVIDVIPGKLPEHLLVSFVDNRRISLVAFHKNNEKTWEQYSNEGIWGEPAKETWKALIAGEFEPEVPKHRDLRIGGSTIKLWYRE